jgi:hypothetical protein
MKSSKGFLKIHHMQDFDTFCKSDDVFFFFFSNEGMLSSIVIAAEFAQNCPKLPNFVKIYPKTISLKNFDILPKIEIFLFSFLKNLVYRRHTKAITF